MKNDNVITQKRSKLHLEVLRILACFFVIVIHTGKDGHDLFGVYPTDNLRYWLYMLVPAIDRASVPLFSAISGALLLKKDESIKNIYIYIS